MKDVCMVAKPFAVCYHMVNGFAFDWRHDCCKIKCKNTQYRYVNVNDVIEFCDTKELCYMIVV